MRILISGVKGFIGKNLLNHLKQYDLIGLGRNEELINGTKIYSTKKLSKIPFEPDIIILCHAAVASGSNSISNDELFESNVSLTKEILKKFRNSFIIYLSSCSIYKIDQNKVVKENSEIDPNSSYSISKLWGEKLSFQRENAVILRLSSVYGPSMKANTIIPNYINSALSKKVIEVWGKGVRYQNYIHVDDVVEMIKCIIKKKSKLKNEILLGVFKKEYQNLDLAKIISKYIDCKIRFSKTDLSPSIKYDNLHTLSILEWKPKIDLDKGIKKYIECIDTK